MKTTRRVTSPYGVLIAVAISMLTACGPGQPLGPTLTATATATATSTPTSAPTSTPTAAATIAPSPQSRATLAPTQEPGAVEGVIFRSDTGQHFSNVLVSVTRAGERDLSGSSETDANGYYSIASLRPGNYTTFALLTFSSAGQSPCRINPGEIVILPDGGITWLFLETVAGEYILAVGPIDFVISSGETLEFDVDLISYEQCP